MAARCPYRNTGLIAGFLRRRGQALQHQLHTQPQTLHCRGRRQHGPQAGEQRLLPAKRPVVGGSGAGNSGQQPVEVSDGEADDDADQATEHVDLHRGRHCPVTNRASTRSSSPSDAPPPPRSVSCTVSGCSGSAASTGTTAGLSTAAKRCAPTGPPTAGLTAIPDQMGAAR